VKFIRIRGLIALRTALGTDSQKIKARQLYKKGRQQRLMHHRNASYPRPPPCVSSYLTNPKHHPIKKFDQSNRQPKHAYLTIQQLRPNYPHKEIFIIAPIGRQSRSCQHRISSSQNCSQLHTTFPLTSTSASLEHHQDACSLHPSL
jgi:hypothetical protein